MVEVDGQLKTGPRRRDRRAAGRRGVRLRHRAARVAGLRDDARLPPQHLPGRRGHAGPGAAQAVRRRPAARRQLHDASSPARCASTWRAWASGRSTRWSAARTAWRCARRSTTGRRATSTSAGSSRQPDVPADVRAPTARSPRSTASRRRWTRRRCSTSARAGARRRASRSAPRCPIRNVNRVVGHDARLRGHPALGPRRAAGRHDPPAVPRARPARASARSSRAGSRCALEGDANDYLGKGLSGGRIVVFPPAGRRRSSPTRT